MATRKPKVEPVTHDDLNKEVLVSEESVAEVLDEVDSVIPLIVVEATGPVVRGDLSSKVTEMPRVSVSMSRKVNTGDYENLDFHFSIQVPLGLTDTEAAAYSQLCSAAIQQGINVVNPEVNERYKKVKELVSKRQKS